MNRLSGMAISVGIIVAFCLAMPAAWADDNVWAEFDITRDDDDFILIPVTIADQAYQFIVDTGCSWCVVDKSLKSQLSSTGRQARLNRKETVDIYHFLEARLGGVDFAPNTETLCRNLAALRFATGHDIRGILGMNVLKSHVLQFDFDVGKLSFLKQSPNAATAEIRLSYSAAHIPMCDVDLPTGDVIPFRIDTGMTGASDIEHDTFVKLQAGGMLTDDNGSILNRRVSLTLHGLQLDRAAALNQMRFGDLVHKRVRVRDGKSNILGLDVLSRYQFTLDFPNDRLFLEKRKQRQKQQPPELKLPTPPRGCPAAIAK